MSSQELTTIRTRIKDRLDTIGGLGNYKNEPDAIPSAPFSILGGVSIDYNTDMGGGRDFHFRLFVAVAEMISDNAWDELEQFLAASGPKSIKEALEGATTAAPAPGDFTVVSRAENCGAVRYRDRTFVGGEFVIDVQSGG